MFTSTPSPSSRLLIFYIELTPQSARPKLDSPLSAMTPRRTDRATHSPRDALTPRRTHPTPAFQNRKLGFSISSLLSPFQKISPRRKEAVRLYDWMSVILISVCSLYRYVHVLVRRSVGPSVDRSVMRFFNFENEGFSS